MHAPINGPMIIENLFGSIKYDPPFMVTYGDIQVPVLGHTGIDISCPTGTPVLAAWPGIVTTGFDPLGFGNYITLTTSDHRTVLYGHLASYLVTKGTRVDAGKAIALSGTTGKSTGPHVHVETSHENPDYLNGFRGCYDWLHGLDHKFVQFIDLRLV